MTTNQSTTGMVQRGGRHDHYDVVVIGGGAAGLNAALTLGRARRSVLVVDGGQQRNAPASAVHSYLGHEGTSPQEFLTVARREATAFGVEIFTGTVVAAAPAEDTGFRVTTDSGRAVHCRRLLLATGLVDELPDIPGVAERWAREVLHCPYCHGWEVRGEPIGVLSTGPVGVEQALLWSQWSEKITLLPHTGPRPDEEALRRLRARDVSVVDGEVTSLEISDDRLDGVVLADGARVPLTHLVVAPHLTARVDGLEELGLKVVELELFGRVAGTYVPTNAQGATDVPGVFAAGNVATLTETVIGSAGAGLRVAAALNMDLINDDIRRAMAEG